jgi:hypothetical protein
MTLKLANSVFEVYDFDFKGSHSLFNGGAFRILDRSNEGAKVEWGILGFGDL